jgi:uncharacterized Zn finger protein (UPF0148 family)
MKGYEMENNKDNFSGKISVKCPDCSTENTEDSKFCAGCGTKLQINKSSENRIKCPKCGTLNRSGATFCADCGKNLFGKAVKKHKTRKLAKKFYKGSKGLIKSTQSRGIRKTAKKETWDALRIIDSLTGGKLRKFDQSIHKSTQSKTKSKSNHYGYLICDRCYGHYELKKGISADDFKVCTCGGKLSYSRRLR